MPSVNEAFQTALRTHQAGNIAEAERLYRGILATEPQHADARHLLGIIAHQQGRHDFAIEAIRYAIGRNPGFHGYHHNLGGIFLDLGRFDEAIASFQRALQLDAAFAETYYNLASALRSVGRLDEAEDACRRALRLKAHYPEAVSNLGIVLEEQGRYDEAWAAFTESLQLAPDYADAHLNRALLELLLGNFAAGWSEYDWLWKASVAPQQRIFAQPRWRGDPLAGRTILLHCEQGLGDTVQFVRYAPRLAEQGARVLVLCQPTLVELVRSSPGVEAAAAEIEVLPSFDVQAPLPALPGIFRSTCDNLPATVPYLFPNVQHVATWGRRLASDSHFKIGIAWQGEPRHRRDFYRSFPLAALAPLSRVPGVQLYSLQVGTGREQLNAAPLEAQVIDLADNLVDFSATAAAVKNLDLVVTCDSALAHLSGAIGAPVWMALPFVPDWRWLLAREDSPWYPTMRLVRQPQIGGWGDVFQRIARDVAELIDGRRGAS